MSRSGTPEKKGRSFFYKELNIALEYFGGEDEFKLRDIDAANSVGFEYLRIFSGEYGDWLTIDFQFRLTNTNMNKVPRSAYANYNLNFDFDPKKFKAILTNDMNFMPEIHNAYASFKLPSHGNYLKIGHFDIPFGLEPLLDTHPTILQTQAVKNVGFKRDWGFSLSGNLPTFDYELSATIGCGGATKIWRKDGSYLFAGRIGTPLDTLQYGFSFLYGEVLQSLYDDYLSNKSVLRKRIGLDIQYEYRSYLFKGELACGKDEDRDVLGTFWEVDYTIPSYQKLQLESQLKYFINDLDKNKSDDTTLTLGASYKLSGTVTLRCVWSHDLNLMMGKEDNVFALQVYYYSI